MTDLRLVVRNCSESLQCHNQILRINFISRQPHFFCSKAALYITPAVISHISRNMRDREESRFRPQNHVPFR